MRIKWKSCNTEDISKALMLIEKNFDIELNTINLYVSFKKNRNTYNIYDFTNDNPEYLELSGELRKEQLRNIKCIKRDDYYIIQSVLESISSWKPESKKMILNYLLKQLSVEEIIFKDESLNYTTNNDNDVKKVILQILESLDILPPN